MHEKCAKACANCCIDYSDDCASYASNDHCTDTSMFGNIFFSYFSINWHEWMQGNCRESCESCDLNFTPSPTTPPVVCDDGQFKYEIVADHDYRYNQWFLNYKYPDLIDVYKVPDKFLNSPFRIRQRGVGIIDGFHGDLPKDFENRYYGCASYSCFYFRFYNGFSKIYDADTGTLIAQSTERTEKLTFCHFMLQLRSRHYHHLCLHHLQSLHL